MTRQEYEIWLREQRLDSAWRSFAFNAGQRMTVFNFFIIFSGILGSAYSVLLQAEMHIPAALAALTGSWLAICFLMLEFRNEELVHTAEDTIRALEKEFLFVAYRA